MADDKTPNRRLPLPAPEHAAVIDASRIAEAIRLIDNDLLESLSQATLDRVGRVLLGAVQHIKDGDATRVPTTAAIKEYVADELSDLVGSSPAALDTLSELASALGNDPNFATSVINQLSTKASLAAHANDYTDKDKVLTNLGAGVTGKSLFKAADASQVWGIVGTVGRADPAMVATGIDDSTFVTPKALHDNQAWSVAKKITLTTASTLADVVIPTTGRILRLTMIAGATGDFLSTNQVVFQLSIDGGKTFLNSANSYAQSVTTIGATLSSYQFADQTYAYLSGRCEFGAIPTIITMHMALPYAGSTGTTYTSYITSAGNLAGQQNQFQQATYGICRSFVRPTHIRIVRLNNTQLGVGTTILAEVF